MKKMVFRLLKTEINSNCNRTRLPSYSCLDFWTKFLEKYHSALYRPAFLFKKQHYALLSQTHPHFFHHYQALGLEAITDQDLLNSMTASSLLAQSYVDMKHNRFFLLWGVFRPWLHFSMLSQNRKLFDIFFPISRTT